ncbi:hypothetical protein ERUR111494_02935 [Erysipelothrix urinaevulpis]|uniref:hypothetical protein n=1 Tax=Erysipelothrix urinaevulpis TaxID=2683717 RepID=UPI00135BC9AD|nr:hypothetical protein [Erysipelothrix urinaevulpis]
MKNKYNMFVDKHYKKLVIGLIIGVLMGLIMHVLIISNHLQTNRELSSLLKDRRETIAVMEPKIKSLESENKTLKETNLELSKEEIQKEIESKITKLKDEESELSLNKKSLSDDIKSLENDKKRLEGDIIKSKGAPKHYPAGKLTVGKDIDPGRYKIYNGSSNYIVRDSFGGLQVNIILGGRLGVDEYINTFVEGDEIEARSSFSLLPIQ